MNNMLELAIKIVEEYEAVISDPYYCDGENPVETMLYLSAKQYIKNYS